MKTRNKNAPSKGTDLLPTGTPSEILRLRFMALRQGDFGFVYDSCHPESNFRKQFPDRSDYIDYARKNVSGIFTFGGFSILREEVSGNDGRVIVHVEFFSGERVDEYLELSTFRMTAKGWRYLCGQKLLPGQFRADWERTTFEDFQKVDEKLIF